MTIDADNSSKEMLGSTREINKALKEMAKSSKRLNISGIDGQDSLVVGWDEKREVRIKGNPGYYLGAYNKGAVITLTGDTGDLAGDTMLGGGLIILGNCGDRCGTRMKNGIIVIKGDAGDGLGHGMYGGTILLDGNAKGSVGLKAEGGTVIVSGNIKGIPFEQARNTTLFVGGSHPTSENMKRTEMTSRDVSKLRKYFDHYAVKGDPSVFEKYIMRENGGIEIDL